MEIFEDIWRYFFCCGPSLVYKQATCCLLGNTNGLAAVQSLALFPAVPTIRPPKGKQEPQWEKPNSYSKDPHCAGKTMHPQTSCKMMSKIKPTFGLANCLCGLQGIIICGQRKKKKKNQQSLILFPICQRTLWQRTINKIDLSDTAELCWESAHTVPSPVPIYWTT